MNISSHVSVNLVAGTTHPRKKCISVESYVDGVGSFTASKLSSLKASVGSRPSIGPNSSRNLVIRKNQIGLKLYGLQKDMKTIVVVIMGRKNGHQW